MVWRWNNVELKSLAGYSSYSRVKNESFAYGNRIWRSSVSSIMVRWDWLLKRKPS